MTVFCFEAYLHIIIIEANLALKLILNEIDSTLEPKKLQRMLQDQP